MNKWDNIMKAYLKTGKIPHCPFCKADGVCVEEYKGKIRDSISFLCTKCGKGIHYDGLIKK